MTSLTKRKTKLEFETEDAIKERGKYRPVMFHAQPYFANVRLKGTRTSFPVSYGAIYHLAARLAAAKAREEKKAAKKKQLI